MLPSEPPQRGSAANSLQRAEALRQHIFSSAPEKFNGKPWELVRAIEDFADTQQLPMIFRENKISVVRAELAAKETKPRVIVEFGTYVGTSTIGWGASLKELNPDGTDLHVYSFEHDADRARIARDLIKLAGLEDVVTILEGSGAESLKKLHAEGKIRSHGVDMVFLDHWKESYKPDLQLCEELKIFHLGSFVATDNVDNPGAPDYAAYVEKGGSGEPGAVQYETKSIEVAGIDHGPKIVVISKVTMV